jgi:hypothetical protein
MGPPPSAAEGGGAAGGAMAGRASAAAAAVRGLAAEAEALATEVGRRVSKIPLALPDCLYYSNPPPLIIGLF